MPPQLPPRVLPVLYFSVSHVALALAAGAVALDPRGVSGFFYHARMLAIVHLVTLGWITSSILGALYLVGPIAMRLVLSATWLDYIAFGFVLTGIIGMVSHFWIAQYGGMAWSAATVATGILLAGLKVVRHVAGAALPKAIKTHVVFAFVNILAAATVGVLIGFDKTYHFLPGIALANVFAHAHLAAIGWASMMVVGIAYRLLPMILPAQMPAGRSLWLSAVLLQAGVSGLFVSLLFRSGMTGLFAALIIAGFGGFFYHVAWMLRRRRSRPPGLRTPDPAVLHAGMAFGSLALAAASGLWLTMMQDAESMLRVAMAYGVFGLVGFLAQIVVGMEGRLLPIFAWYWAYANTDFKGPVLSPHEMPWRTGQEIMLVLWMFGVPALAGGLAFDAVPFVSAGAWCLLAATLLDAVNVAWIVRHAFGRRS